MTPTFTWKPLTPATWADFETLFGARGACAGCWCMWWRLPRKIWTAQQHEPNRLAMKALVESGQVPGLLGYLDGTCAGWVSVGPRAAFPTLETVKAFAPVDERVVWSIVCFFTGKEFRRSGMMEKLISAAVDFARAGGARTLEAYPFEPTPEKKFSHLAGFVGIAEVFQRAGFVEVARRSERRPIMRLEL